MTISVLNVDKGIGFLVILDLSAGFDSEDHAILLEYMKAEAGIKCCALV